MKRHEKVLSLILSGILLAGIGCAIWPLGQSKGKVMHFDCGTSDSEVMEGYMRLTADDTYSRDRGYGWESPSARGTVFTEPIPNSDPQGSAGLDFMHWTFDNNRNALNGDAVVSEDDLVFRCDVPKGKYRVRVIIGDMTQAIGSMDVSINGELIGEHIAAWTAGGYRGTDQSPFGWFNPLRATVQPKDGAIEIRLAKNQSYYDQQLKEQAEGPNPYERWYHKSPVRKAPPYGFIGYPFIYNSVMAIEIEPYTPPVVECIDEQMRLTQDIDSPALKKSIEQFNKAEFKESFATLSDVTEADAQVAKAIVMLWLTGRLEIEAERTSVPEALEILRPYVEANPGDLAVAEILNDAEMFRKAHIIHLERGIEGTNHFTENNKAICWWWTIQPDSPLYYKARLMLGRAMHQLSPYFPLLGTPLVVFQELEKKFPDNRFVKYRLHGDGIFAKGIPGDFGDWEPYGDGTDFYDWVMVDYEAKAKGAPEWVQAIYPAYAWLVDLSEWWITFRQEESGSVGGGSGDDVEIVGLFGYYAYISEGVSDMSINGAGKLIDGVWNLPVVDSELGYCSPLADAEHTAEWTGNTLGMMVQIDYGNPLWIERSMKTAKLMRDFWTDFNDLGRRHFRANFFGASQVGTGDQMSDSWINYRAVRPATAVWWYNRNPAVAKLYCEVADAWVADAMSTERGKPKGVLPAEVGFPEGTLGGINSPNWYTASHTPGTVNYDWKSQQYKDYITDILLTAYHSTGDMKYIEPLELEYKLAQKYDVAPDMTSGRSTSVSKVTKAAPGSEQWVAEHVSTSQYVGIKHMLEGRKGGLENSRTLKEVVESGEYVKQNLKWRWPIMTSGAGPTDRVAFGGIPGPFFIYTGGAPGGPLLRAAVTYENTTKDFAAAVLGYDAQGLRIAYYSLTDDTRTIGVIPWELEPSGTYRLKYGPDANEDLTMDSVVEQRDFMWPQPGTPIYLEVKPRVQYVIEIDQLERGRSVELAPDPGLSKEDIRWSEGRLMARIHNVGSETVRDVWVAAYDGDPEAGGKQIGKDRIPSIDAPVDLEPRTTTIGFNWSPSEDAHEIYIVVDPDDTIKDEISTFNNTAHTTMSNKMLTEGYVGEI